METNELIALVEQLDADIAKIEHLQTKLEEKKRKMRFMRQTFAQLIPVTNVAGISNEDLAIAMQVFGMWQGR